MKKKRRTEVATWYAVRQAEKPHLWLKFIDNFDPFFANATLYANRSEALYEIDKNPPTWGVLEIVDVRATTLSTKTKAAKRRTR